MMKKFGELPLTPRAKSILSHANEHAIKRGAKAVDVIHLILGIMQKQDGLAFQAYQLAANVLMGLELFHDVTLKVEKLKGVKIPASCPKRKC